MRGWGPLVSGEYVSYDYRMKKAPISVTLSVDNLVWLRARTVAERNRSVSDTLDRLVTQARSGRDGRLVAERSIVGSVTIGERDPDLSTADVVIRDMFTRSLGWSGREDEDEAEGRVDRVAEKSGGG